MTRNPLTLRFEACIRILGVTVGYCTSPIYVFVRTSPWDTQQLLQGAVQQVALRRVTDWHLRFVGFWRMAYLHLNALSH